MVTLLGPPSLLFGVLVQVLECLRLERFPLGIGSPEILLDPRVVGVVALEERLGELTELSDVLLVVGPKLLLEWVGLLLRDAWSVYAAADSSLILGAGHGVVVLRRKLASERSDAGIDTLSVQVRHWLDPVRG